MREGIIISGIAHVLAIVLAIAGLPFLDSSDMDDMTVVPVELVRLEDLSQAPKPKPEPKEETEKAARPERRVEERIEAPEDSVPTLEKAIAPRKKPQPQQKVITAKLAPRARPQRPKRFDANRIAALLDRRAEEETPEPAPEEQPEKKLPEVRSALASLDRDRLTAVLRDAMRRQIERCWIIPAGARDAENLTIRIKVFLNPDGSLARPPEITDRARMYRSGQEFFRTAAESARRAVQKCTPLKLPREHYEIWRESELIFDPSKMLS